MLQPTVGGVIRDLLDHLNEGGKLHLKIWSTRDFKDLVISPWLNEVIHLEVLFSPNKVSSQLMHQDLLWGR